VLWELLSNHALQALMTAEEQDEFAAKYHEYSEAQLGMF
jgi:hypothetical protein